MANVTTYQGNSTTNLINKRFGKWVVIDYAPKNKYGYTQSLCRCECGKEQEVKNYNLLKGHSSQCGSCKNKTFLN